MSKSNNYTVRDLELWSKKIEKLALSFGLDFYPQEFELVDYKTMLEAQAYTGMPSFYPHHSFGKNYELFAALYRYGLSYLPYELVINSDPCLARLMTKNDLAMQILTMAHVYGHNNFFKNNIHFRRLTNASSALKFFHSSSDIIRQYSADPAIGPRAVAKCITAAHGIRYQCRDVSASGLPDQGQDLLLFLVDNSPREIAFWERTIALIVAEAFNYLRPQMMTPIMNEGWASFWHYKILEALELSPPLRFAIEKHHNNVVRLPDNPSELNPYFVGFETWKEIEKKYPEKMFGIMKADQDISFVDEYMDQKLMARVGLFLKDTVDGNVVVDSISDEEGFKKVKSALIKQIGLGQIPIIEGAGSNEENKKGLHLKHIFEGRHLEPKRAAKTLEHFYYFWPGPIILETVTYRRQLPFLYKFDGQKHSARRKP